MTFQTMDTDVLLYIIALTDIWTIVSLSRVNKYFNGFCFTKELWIMVIRDLSFRRLLDSPADATWEDFSAGDLVESVKRAVLRPVALDAIPPLYPIIFRQISISLNDLRLESDGLAHLADGTVFSELLPGGKYIVCRVQFFTHNSVVACWNVHTGRLVWSWGRPNHTVLDATFDLRGDGSTAVVSILYGSGDDYQYALILEANFDTGDSCDLLSLAVSTRDGRLQLAHICGAYVAYVGNSVEDFEGNVYPRVLLVNWCTTQFLVLSCHESPKLGLLPTHMILLFAPSGIFATNNHLRVYSIASLHHLWRSISDFTLKNATDVRLTDSVNLSVPNNGLLLPTIRVNKTALAITASLVHDEVYEVMVGVQDAWFTDPSLTASLWTRLIGTTPPHKKLVCKTTLSRYHLFLPIRNEASATPVRPHIVLKTTVRPEDTLVLHQLPHSRSSYHSFSPEARTRPLVSTFNGMGGDDWDELEDTERPSEVWLSNAGTRLLRYGLHFGIYY
ncbi:hypothetical protein DFH07DRAFT_839090 [Mycena maculata]|uniref:F-box domain-containing protein n=1 Tax=Mycena maculata TaxID=230809 RepID=A0AAD7N1P2_9AGAR|nr:hypothetical protein DFH07DRAFT_839090 [Mycena maculata]